MKSVFVMAKILTYFDRQTWRQRRALLIGIDQYPNFDAEHQLHGCVQDVQVMRETLRKNFGFLAKNIRLLADKRATRKAILDGMDRLQLRALADSLRNKWKTAVVVLASAEDSTVSIISAVTKDLTAKVHAGKLVGAVAQAVGGKGGGRPDIAEGGGKDPAALNAALEQVYTDVETKL